MQLSSTNETLATTVAYYFTSITDPCVTNATRNRSLSLRRETNVIFSAIVISHFLQCHRYPGKWWPFHISIATQHGNLFARSRAIKYLFNTAKQCRSMIFLNGRHELWDFIYPTPWPAQARPEAWIYSLAPGSAADAAMMYEMYPTNETIWPFTSKTSASSSRPIKLYYSTIRARTSKNSVTNEKYSTMKALQNYWSLGLAALCFADGSKRQNSTPNTTETM